MAENGIGAFSSIDLITAVRYYEQWSDHSPSSATWFGWCLQTGRGIPIDFTIAADFDGASGINSFGCCLECGQGVDTNIGLGVRYYRRSGSQSHSDGMYNFARCLEYGKEIDRDIHRAAKYYCFGICLATRYYQLSAQHGHPDGANNFGFGLEHGRGVKQNIEMRQKITNSLHIAVIPKLNSIIVAVFACSANGKGLIALPMEFPIHHRLIVCPPSSGIRLSD